MTKKRKLGVGGPSRKIERSLSDKSHPSLSSPLPSGAPHSATDSDQLNSISLYEKYAEIAGSAWQSEPDGEDMESEIRKKHADMYTERIPTEYRAQVFGRCQRQYLQSKPAKGLQDSQVYLQEWIGKKAAKMASMPVWRVSINKDPLPYSDINQFHAEGILIIIEVKFDWRLISNGGIDEGFIRPVIGAGGWPIIPGSSIKGLFRRSCTKAQAREWCGDADDIEDSKPGCLRFHGAWPKDTSWTEGLLDVTHPQQNWQLGFTNGREDHNANALLSLLSPFLQIGISCRRELKPQEREEIEGTMQRALSLGLGGRTAAGYGIPAFSSESPLFSIGEALFSAGLQGQGSASRLLDRSAEIRPTMFRAALRGMALRLFGGLVEAKEAIQHVNDLFGGFNANGKPSVGILANRFIHLGEPYLGLFGEEKLSRDVYACEGDLRWFLVGKSLNASRTRDLQSLLCNLHALVMALGGFGRSWRRPDHRIFMPSYTTRPIGCQWQWRNPEQMKEFIPKDAKSLGDLIENARQSACAWLRLSSITRSRPQTPWREVIHPGKMIVWCRQVNSILDAEAIRWIHSPGKYEQRSRKATDLRDTQLRGGLLTVNNKPIPMVGRLWIRMMPIQILPSQQHDAANESGLASPVEMMTGEITENGPTSKAQVVEHDVQIPNLWPGPYLEIVTCFPGSLQSQLIRYDGEETEDEVNRLHTTRFVQSMEEGAGVAPPFERAWGRV